MPNHVHIICYWQGNKEGREIGVKQALTSKKIILKLSFYFNNAWNLKDSHYTCDG